MIPTNKKEKLDQIKTNKKKGVNPIETQPLKTRKKVQEQDLNRFNLMNQWLKKFKIHLKIQSIQEIKILQTQHDILLQ